MWVVGWPRPRGEQLMADAVYTTADRLDSLLSSLGVDLRTDDDPGATAEVMDEASGELEFFLGTRYDPAHLTGVRWVRTACTVFAAVILCGRRGNPVPESLQERMDRYLAWLAKVQAGQAVLPGVPRSRSACPTMSNQRIDLNRYPATRTERPRSTGEAAGYTRRTDETAGDAVR